jgi:hypothetical protein
MLTITLYGKSLLLSGIGASLGARRDFQIVAIDSLLPDAAERLRAAGSNIVVFDLASSTLESAIALWHGQPNILLIGVDLTTNRALVVHGQSPQLLASGDLMRLIEMHTLAERNA